MKRLSVVLLSLFPMLTVGCSSETVSEGVSCWIVSPQALDAVQGSVSVGIGLSGPVVQAELLVDGTVVSSQEVAEGAETVTLTWESGGHADGEVTLGARVLNGSGASGDADGIQLLVDNTPPDVTLLVERMDVLQGTVNIPATVVEANIESASLVDRDGTLVEMFGALEPLRLDTTTITDGVHWLCVEAVDRAGHITVSDEIPVVVANGGEEMPVEYAPEAIVTIPPNYATTEYHVRGMVPTEEGVTRVISWLTWDGTAGWEMEYAIGEGICPHRGIEYLAAESGSGEIILDLPRSELLAEAEARLPAEEQDSDTFPHNDDILTFGAFFGHVAPLNPADHVNESIPIEMRFVLFH